MTDSTDICTERLRIKLKSPQEVLDFIDGMNPSDRAEVSPEWLKMVRNSESSDPWIHGYSLVETASQTPVGTVAFKGPPSTEGVVEIAYGIDPAFRGRGFATEAAQALTSFAFSTGQVRIVRAHTLPELNASTSVLTKCGFKNVGELIDPEDGRVWRWEIHREKA